MKKLLTIMALATTVVTASAQLQSGINMNDLDKNVRPGDDFYEYACGGWMKANPLPAAYSRYHLCCWYHRTETERPLQTGNGFCSS